MATTPELLYLLSGDPAEFAEVVAGMQAADVTGIVIYFTVAAVVLRGTVL